MKNDIIKKALISEKSFTKVAENKYTFVVSKEANKEEISAAIADLFNVSVISINTANYIGKIKRSKKGNGKRSDYKKAILCLKKGDKIDLFDVEEEKKDKKDQKAEKSKTKEIKEDKDTTVKVREKKK